MVTKIILSEKEIREILKSRFNLDSAERVKVNIRTETCGYGMQEYEREVIEAEITIHEEG